MEASRQSETHSIHQSKFLNVITSKNFDDDEMLKFFNRIETDIHTSLKQEDVFTIIDFKIAM